MTANSNDGLSPDKRNRLVDAVRDIKIAAAERSDVVVEMKEADRARLEILAQELEPVFADVPTNDERFDFALSSGLQPRLWIDATAHVIMGKDRRQYRFVRDTRMGRIILAESNKTAPIIEAVTKYIAERLYERELAFAADDIIYRAGPAQRLVSDSEQQDEAVHVDGQGSADEPQPTASKPNAPETTESAVPMAARDRESRTAMSSLGWLLIGLFIGGGILLLTYRDAIFPSAG